MLPPFYPAHISQDKLTHGVPCDKRSNSSSSGDSAVAEAMLNVVRHLKRPQSDIGTFNGDPLKYRRWMRQFNTRIVPYTDTDDERLNFLEQYTSGDVNKIVQSFSYLDTTIGYQSALRELEERYGDNEIIATAFINKALKWPQIKPNDAKSMDDLSVFLAECNNAVRSIDSMRILEYPDNLRKLVSKLPFYLHDRWRNEVQRAKEKFTPIKFSDLVCIHKTRS